MGGSAGRRHRRKSPPDSELARRALALDRRVLLAERGGCRARSGGCRARSGDPAGALGVDGERAARPGHAGHSPQPDANDRRPAGPAHRAPGAYAGGDADRGPFPSWGQMVNSVNGERSTVNGTNRALEILDSVKDPEVPVLSVVELGVVRGVEVTGDAVTVTVTPTYTEIGRAHVLTPV